MEYYVICESCGKGYTYTDEDVKKNMSDATGNALSAIGAMAGALTGNWGGSIANQQNYKELRVFNRCPHCGSGNVKQVSLEEFQKSQKKIAGSGSGVQINTNATIESLIKRVSFMIEDQEWDDAEVYCNQILDQDPENIQAYVFLTLALSKTSSLEELPNKDVDIRTTQYYKRLVQFGDADLQERLKKIESVYDKRIEDKKKEEIEAKLQQERQEAERLLQEEAKRQQELEDKYLNANKLMNSASLSDLNTAIKLFRNLGDYKDSKEKEKECQALVVEAKEPIKKRNKKIVIICCIVAVIAAVCAALAYPSIQKSKQYSVAEQAFSEGRYNDAISVYEELGGYKDSGEKKQKCIDETVALIKTYMSKGEYTKAYALCTSMESYSSEIEALAAECKSIGSIGGYYFLHNDERLFFGKSFEIQIIPQENAGQVESIAIIPAGDDSLKVVLKKDNEYRYSGSDGDKKYTATFGGDLVDGVSLTLVRTKGSDNKTAEYLKNMNK